MNRRLTLTTLLAALALQPLPLPSQEPAPGPAPPLVPSLAAPPRAVRPPLNAQQLKALVEQLGADEFLARETAMLELVAAGSTAIAPVSASLGTASLEASSRALHVLQQIGLSPDPETQEAARAALIRSASQRENPTVARRAADTLAQLMHLRSAQALAELEKLGAKVVRSQSFNGVSVEEIIESIEIGPDYRGAATDLGRLKWLTAIKLVLVGEKIRDDWLKAAAAMTEVEELHLYQAAVSDAGLAAFAEHPNVRELGIYYAPLTGAVLAHAQKLPRLSFVKLYGTRIDRADALKFKEALGLPEDKLDHRKGAFLGVGCMTIDNACVLSTVHAGSPAEKAGLQRDDVLVRFNDVKVADFAALTAQISQLNSGDVAEIEVQREVEDEDGRIRTKKIVVKATLAPWEVDLAVENGQRP